MKQRVYEVKTISEALHLAQEEMNISMSELKAEIVTEKKGFLGIGGKIEVSVIPSIEGIDKGKAYLQMILEANQIEGFIEKKVRGNIVEFNIDAGDENGQLIGKNSKHLVAIQTLLSIVINRYYEEDDQKIVKVDIGGYRKRRESHLERMAVDFGKQVVRTKQTIKLDNLNSYERKIIHDKLSTWKEIKTYSEGEEPNRHLIIEAK